MAYNTRAIKTDLDGKPIPQYFNSLTDQYEELRGTGGANRVMIYDANGNPVSVVNNKIAIRASEIEALINLLGDALTTGAGIKKITDPVKLAGNSSLAQGNLLMSGSAQQLPNASCKIITIQAHPDNNEYVYIGMNSYISSTSHMAVLSPGSFYTLTVANSNMIYVRGSNGDRISWGREA